MRHAESNGDPTTLPNMFSNNYNDKYQHKILDKTLKRYRWIVSFDKKLSFMAV